MGVPDAAKDGSLHELKNCKDQGEDISAADGYGFTALMTAAEHGLLEMVKFLLSNGADVNQKNKLDWSALCYAATRRRIPVVKYLVENGANVNEVCQGASILKWVIKQPAAHQGEEIEIYKITEYLVNNGADFNEKLVEFAEHVYRDKMTMELLKKKLDQKRLPQPGAAAQEEFSTEEPAGSDAENKADGREGPGKKPVSAKEVKKPVSPKEVKKPVSPKEVRKPVSAKEVRKPVSAKEVRKPVSAKEVRKPVSPKEVRTPVSAKEVKKPVSAKASSEIKKKPWQFWK